MKERFKRFPLNGVAMGIKLTDIVVRRPISEGELNGRVVAFDAYNMLYQFLSSIRTPEGHPLASSDGTVISHLKGLLTRTSNLVKNGIKPVMVFDGKPHELKKGTLDLRRERKERAQKEWERAVELGDMEKARSKAMQTSHLTEEMVDQTKELLTRMGIPVIQAPSDGEGQASFMCKRGDAYAVSSQDFDSLLFGCPILVRNLGVTGRRKLPGRRSYISVDPEAVPLEETLEKLGITREQLVDMAILIGTDFNEGVKGIGPKTALKLVREYGDLETISKEKRIPLLEYDEIRNIFLDPSVTNDYSINFRDPDDEAVKEMLVDGLGFGLEGVEKSLSDMRNTPNKNENTQTSLDGFC
jgi:flap endonuclease-1